MCAEDVAPSDPFCRYCGASLGKRPDRSLTERNLLEEPDQPPAKSERPSPPPATGPAKDLAPKSGRPRWKSPAAILLLVLAVSGLVVAGVVATNAANRRSERERAIDAREAEERQEEQEAEAAAQAEEDADELAIDACAFDVATIIDEISAGGNPILDYGMESFEYQLAMDFYAPYVQRSYQVGQAQAASEILPEIRSRCEDEYGS